MACIKKNKNTHFQFQTALPIQRKCGNYLLVISLPERASQVEAETTLRDLSNLHNQAPNLGACVSAEVTNTNLLNLKLYTWKYV